MGNNIVTSNAQVTNYSQLVPKSYISGEQLYPPILTSLVACYSLYTWTDVIIRTIGINQQVTQMLVIILAPSLSCNEYFKIVINY